MKFKKKLITTIVLVIVSIKLLLMLDVYAFNLSDPISSFFKQLYPAKIVGNHMVSVYDKQTMARISMKLQPEQGKDLFDQLVYSEKMRNLASSLKLKPQSDDVSDELTYIKKGNEQEYIEVINTYFGSNESDFVKFVVYPKVWEALLRRHYNSDVTRNSEQFKLAQNLLARIQSGEKFEDLAKQYSSDRISGQLGGDLGFVEHGQIIPELEDEATISTVGKVNDKIIVTRLGYHIIYPVETASKDGVKLWHIKHILIETAGFEEWLETATSGIRVINIL